MNKFKNDPVSVKNVLKMRQFEIIEKILTTIFFLFKMLTLDNLSKFLLTKTFHIENQIVKKELSKGFQQSTFTLYGKTKALFQDHKLDINISKRSKDMFD